jgi:hypothetical protein
LTSPFIKQFNDSVNVTNKQWPLVNLSKNISSASLLLKRKQPLVASRTIDDALLVFKIQKPVYDKQVTNVSGVPLVLKRKVTVNTSQDKQGSTDNNIQLGIDQKETFYTSYDKQVTLSMRVSNHSDNVTKVPLNLIRQSHERDIQVTLKANNNNNNNSGVVTKSPPTLIRKSFEPGHKNNKWTDHIRKKNVNSTTTVIPSVVTSPKSEMYQNATQPTLHSNNQTGS